MKEDTVPWWERMFLNYLISVENPEDLDIKIPTNDSGNNISYDDSLSDALNEYNPHKGYDYEEESEEEESQVAATDAEVLDEIKMIISANSGADSKTVREKLLVDKGWQVSEKRFRNLLADARAAATPGKGIEDNP